MESKDHIFWWTSTSNVLKSQAVHSGTSCFRHNIENLIIWAFPVTLYHVLTETYSKLNYQSIKVHEKLLSDPSLNKFNPHLFLFNMIWDKYFNRIYQHLSINSHNLIRPSSRWARKKQSILDEMWSKKLNIWYKK